MNLHAATLAFSPSTHFLGVAIANNNNNISASRCSRRRRRRIPATPLPNIISCHRQDHDHSDSDKAKRPTAAALAAALILMGGTLTQLDPPQPAAAAGLAPTSINPYARRSAEKAYQKYYQQLESHMETLPLGDLKKVVQSGGGGMNVSYRIAGFAAFIAATISVLVVHPLDSIKTRIQAGSGMSFHGLYRGVFGNILKEAPNAAIYLGVYEIIKTNLMSNSEFFHDLPLLTFLIAGALGDAVGSIVRVPAEVINKKLQLGMSKDFGGALKEIFLQSSGRASLWNAWGSVLLRDVPFGGIQIMLYELGKDLLQRNISAIPAFIPSSGLPADILVGSIVGAFTAFITTPADVLVTRIAMASGKNDSSVAEEEEEAILVKARNNNSAWGHVEAICKTEGIAGFFSGSIQRAAYYFVLSALFFGLYESTSRLAQQPAYSLHQVELVRDQVLAIMENSATVFGPGVLGIPPQYLTAMFLFLIHEVPVLISILAQNG